MNEVDMSNAYNYDYVKFKFNEKNYNLISTTYKNAREKLKVICDKGHLYHPTFERFLNGHGCPYCNKNGKITIDIIQKFCENIQYNIIDITNFKNSKSKFSIKCNEGHIYDTTWNYLKTGTRCPKCNGGSRHAYGHIKEYIEKEGYKLISNTYKNAMIKIQVECPLGHRYHVTYANFYQNHRCPICVSQQESSKAEKEILNYVREMSKEIIYENDRTQILNPKTGHYLELDVWMPQSKKAIEYNGGYWHSFPDAIIKDKEKSKQCNEKGISLLIIEEGNWIENKSDCLDKIKTFIC